jgi:hypothetical protein
VRLMQCVTSQLIFAINCQTLWRNPMNKEQERERLHDLVFGGLT